MQPHDSTFADQIPPFQGELILNFGYPGVALGFLVLGWLAGWIRQGFRRSSGAVESFVWMYVGYWFAFLVPGGLAGLAQTFIYFFWPVYVAGVCLDRLSILRPIQGAPRLPDTP